MAYLCHGSFQWNFYSYTGASARRRIDDEITPELLRSHANILKPMAMYVAGILMRTDRHSSAIIADLRDDLAMDNRQVQPNRLRVRMPGGVIDSFLENQEKMAPLLRIELYPLKFGRGLKAPDDSPSAQQV